MIPNTDNMLMFFVKDLGFCHLGSSYEFCPISLQLEKEMFYIIICATFVKFNCHIVCSCSFYLQKFHSCFPLFLKVY